MIIGSPRSGTSILGRVLDRHPLISTWVEPYYIWDYHFRESPHDQMGAEVATDNVRRRIRRAFIHYWKTYGVNLVVDKSPRNCLKIPFVRAVFPEARYIFLLRDGRDTILSIKKQWERKKGIFGNTRTDNQWKNRLRVLRRWSRRRPLWRHLFQSLLFEIGPPRYWLQRRFLHQIRWGGRFGWGPRFKGWQELMDQVTPLEFGAYQWLHCAQGMLQNLPSLKADRYFTLKYEEFTRNPRASLEDLFSFLNKPFPERFMEMIPEIWTGNTDKWRRAMSAKDLKDIGPIIGDTLIDLGYEKDHSWYENADS